MLVLHPHRAPNRARARYRLSLPSSSSPSSSFFLRMLGQVHSLTTVANRLDPKSRTTTKTRTITRKTRTCPKGATGLSPGFQPWEPHQNGCALMGRQTERTNNPEEAVDVMWLVHAGSPGSDGASPSYGVCQATEKRVRSFSFFLEQRSCHFLGLKVQAS